MFYRDSLSFRALTLATAALFFGCETAKETSPAKGKDASTVAAAELPKVATAKPVRQTIVQKTEQPGRIEAYSTTHVHAKVSGFMERLLVDIGDKVTGPKRDDNGNTVLPGQLLAVLVAPELQDELLQKQAMIAQATADMEQSQAAIQVAESVAVSAEAFVEEAMSGQQRAESEYQRWKSESDRMQSLAASKTVTQKLADETKQQWQSADAARGETLAKIRSAKAKLNEAKVGIAKAKADFRSTEAKRTNAEAEYHRVQSLCEYLHIRAPYDGVVTVRSFDSGALVQAARSSEDKPLFTVLSLDKVRVCLDVPESDSILVEAGRKATIKVPALAGRTFEGAVARTGWALQTGTRTLRCEIEVANDSSILRPGMYANVELIIAQKPDVWTLPKGAIIQHEGQPACLTVSSDGTIVRKGIQVGIRSTTDVEVLTGLDGSEEVIITNASAFKDGMKAARAK